MKSWIDRDIAVEAVAHALDMADSEKCPLEWMWNRREYQEARHFTDGCSTCAYSFENPFINYPPHREPLGRAWCYVIHAQAEKKEEL